MDIALYIQGLDDRTDQTLQLLHTYNDAQLSYKVGSKWSILEVLEHICITEYVVCAMVLKPSDIVAESAELFGQAKLKKLVVDLRHQQKIEAPEMLHPKGLIKSLTDFEKQFTELRNTLKSHLLDGTIVISNKTRKHPFLGDMTITDWLHFMLFHTQRHIEQIKETNR